MPSSKSQVFALAWEGNSTPNAKSNAYRKSATFQRSHRSQCHPIAKTMRDLTAVLRYTIT